MGTIVNLIIQLVSGGVGGLVAGKLGAEISLGTLYDILAGIVGGIGIGQLLNSLGLGAALVGGFSVPGFLLNVLISLVGGIAVMLIVASVKKLFSK